jgi:hypothetical protein
MILDFGVQVTDSVTIPVEWANILKTLPNGKPLAGRVHSVSGPVATIETSHGLISVATVTVLGWY